MNLLSSVRNFMLQCGRVWQVLRKPGKEEFKIIAKVSAIGMIIIGLMGFIISIIMALMKIR